MARKSSVIENVREQTLSSDLNRMEQLGAREWLNQFRDMGRTDSDRSTGTGNAHLAQTSNGGVRDYFQKIPTIAKSGASMAITIGAGEALQEDFPVNPDDSGYSVHRWPDTILTPAVGNGANPRIDLIVSVAGETPTDAQIRNVLQDPGSGAVAPEMVFKTNNPTSVLSVIPGTPAASPVPPVAPPGSLILYEILVPTLSTLATQTSLARSLPRQSVYVGTSQHGVLEGCRPIFGSVITGGPLETASADIKLDDVGVNRVVIDGEVLVFAGGVTTGLLPKILIDDAAPAASHNPFFAAAPTADRAYFIYAVGGVWSRSRSKDNGGGSNGLDPVVLIESLVPPMIDGRPTIPIGNGYGGTTVQGALYIGLGYTVYNTTFRKKVFWDDDWCFARGGLDLTPALHPAGTLDFNEGAAAGFSTNINPAAATVVTLGSKPNGGSGMAYSRAKIRASFFMQEAAPVAGTTMLGQIFLGPGVNGDVLQNLVNIDSGFGVGGQVEFEACDIPLAGTKLSQAMAGLAGDNMLLSLHAIAWKMNVNRLAHR